MPSLRSHGCRQPSLPLPASHARWYVSVTFLSEQIATLMTKSARPIANQQIRIYWSRSSDPFDQPVCPSIMHNTFGLSGSTLRWEEVNK